MGNENSSADDTELVTLDYTGRRLEKVSHKDYDKKKVECFNLTNNNIKELPKDLPELKSLILTSNVLKVWPEAITPAIQSYKKLQSLELTANSLRQLPDFISKLPIRKLVLLDNKLRKINIKKSKLQYLDVSHNYFTEIPELPDCMNVFIYDFNICKKLTRSVNLPNIVMLSLVLTGLEKIDDNIVLDKLIKLDLSKNSLKSLPDLSRFSPNLEILIVSDNLLTACPKPPQSIQ